MRAKENSAFKWERVLGRIILLIWIYLAICAINEARTHVPTATTTSKLAEFAMIPGH